MTLEGFAARKTRAAMEADLPPYVTDVDRAPERMIRIGNDWTRRLYDGSFHVAPLPERRPACSLVFVQSADGNTGASNPTSLGGGETDKHVIYEGLSRVAADAVMAGAGTVRDGNIVLSVWHPELVRLREALGKPRHPVQVVATLRGLDLTKGVLFNSPELRVVLLTTEPWSIEMRDAAAARPWITRVVMGAATDLAGGFEKLRELGVERVSCVGGRKIAGQLIDAGLVDEIYLTTSAKPGGEPNTPLYPRALPGTVVVKKHGTGPETGVVFEHYAIQRFASSAPLHNEP